MLTRLLVLALVATGCGTIDGSTCPSSGASQCDGSDVAFCEGGKWVTYPCPSGCSALKSGLCDWSGVANGDRCSPSLSVSLCPADGRALSCVRTSSTAASWSEYACSRCVKGADPKTVLRSDGAGGLLCD